ncbi:MAG: hypothetical protein MZV64_15890 [Ignavibacteriales bacterium]|nr:hypothetical protein [Ignavibacteriales bacterium]
MVVASSSISSSTARRRRSRHPPSHPGARADRGFVGQVLESCVPVTRLTLAIRN